MQTMIKRSFWIPTLLLLAITMWIFTNSQIQLTEANAQKGILNIKDWDENTLLTLAGEWKYYDNLTIKDINNTSEYVTVPHLFTDDKQNNPYGVATYKLTVDGLNPNTLYGMQILHEVSAYRLTVNGKDILKNGTVGYTKETHKPEMRKKIGYFQPDRNGRIDIAIEISNFSYNYGGFWREIIFGTSEKLSKYDAQQDRIEITLFSMILVVGMWFLALYFVNMGLTSLLYFSIICLLIALRVLLTNNRLFYDYIYNISWNVGTRLEFWAGYMLLPVFFLFFDSLKYVKQKKYFIYVAYLSIVCVTLLMVFASNGIYANLLKIYMNLCIVSLLYFFYIIFQGIRHKHTDAKLIFIGLLGFVTTIFIDFYGKVTHYYLPFGTFFMIIFYSIVVTRTILRMKNQHDYLEHAITVDPLTGLKNRYFLNHLMDTELPIEKNDTYYILFFDLNKFKYINDTYGHTIGDAVLVESARRIQHAFPNKDDIVCRFGGDEFIAITMLNDKNDAIRHIAETLSNHFKEAFVIDGTEYFLSVSIGISEYHRGDVLETVIHDSDEAMYEAKKNQPDGGVVMLAKN